MKTSFSTKIPGLHLIGLLLLLLTGLLWTSNASACTATANFTYSNSSNGSVKFTNKSTTTSGTFACAWDFGDGSAKSSSHAPSHTYAANGIYHVCLYVVDSLNTSCNNTYCTYDTVNTYTCTANFEYSNSKGSLAISLSDSGSSALTKGDKRSVSWTFGDGNKGTSDKTSHTYSKSGTYSVCVIVYDSVTACSSYTCKSITVSNCNITSSFTYTNTGLAYSFKSTSTTSSHTSYRWIFGDGKQDSTSGSTVSHTYASGSSTETVYLEIYDSTTGCTAYSSQTITLCHAKSDFSDKASGLTLTFASDSTNGSGVAYSWSWGDKTTNGTGKSPSHTYSANGTYNVCLTATDTVDHCYTTTCSNVTVNYCTLSASFTDSISGHSVKFFGALGGSYGSRISVKWYFGDGDSATGLDPTHTYGSSVTSETVTLRVYDSASKCLAYVNKTITFCTTKSDWTYTASGLTVSFKSDASNKSTVRYSWDFDDNKSGSTSSNPSHTFSATGTYNVCLTATDSASGCSTTTCQNISVNNCSLTASFTDSISGHTVKFYGKANSSRATVIWIFGDGSSDSTTGFTATHTYGSSVSSENVYMRVYDSTTKCLTYATGTITLCDAKSDFTSSVSGYSASFKSDASNSSRIRYSWSFGDKGTSNSADPSHSYSANGTYTVCLTATDSASSCSTTTCNSVTISNCTLTASFTDSVSSRTVKFYGTTNGSSHIKVTWVYGDGSTDSTSGLYSHHTYTASGDSFRVYMRVYDSTTKCLVYASEEVHVSCGALSDYTYSASGLAVAFASDSKNSSSATYVWDFNDKSSSTSANPSHTYSTGGTYNVCLTVTENGCSNTTCHSITVSGCSLTASFTDSIDNHKVKFFGTTNGSSHIKVTWIFGDGSTDSTTGLTATHTYGSSVYTETVYMVVYDSATKCRVYYYTKISFCHLSASWTDAASDSLVKFYADSTNPSGTSYIWSFGDGSSGSSAKNPTHIYSTPGTYRVCLYAIDSPCSAYQCDSVTVTFHTTKTYCIYGKVTTGKTAGYPAKVYLITFNAKDSSLAAVDSTTTNSSGEYYFCGLGNGTYYTKAALATSNSYYKYFIPTYHYDATRWSSADKIVISNASDTGENIIMKLGTNPGGAGFIGGKISAGANKTGDPEEDILVILYDDNGNASDYTYSNAQGLYSFSGVAFGSYTVEGEVPGKVCYPAYVTITDTTSTDNTVNLQVNSTTITAAINMASTNRQSIRVFPNPVTDKLSLALNLSHASQANIMIYDMTGKMVSETNTTIGAGNQIYEMDAAMLPAGLYFLKMELVNDNSLMEARFVKAR